MSGKARGLAGGAPPSEQMGQTIGLALERGLGGEQQAQISERFGSQKRSRGRRLISQRRELAHQPGAGPRAVHGPGKSGADDGDKVTTRTDHQQGIRGDIHDCPPFITGDRGDCRWFAPRFGSALLSGLGGIGPRRAHVSTVCIPSKRLAGFSSARLYSVFVR